MGDIAVDVFLKTLKELITSSKLDLIKIEKNQLQSLAVLIRYLRGFLKDTEKKRNDHSELMELVMQIRDLVSEAENIVELFVVHAFKFDNVSFSQETEKKYPDPLSLDLGIVTKGFKILTTNKMKKVFGKEIVDKKIFDNKIFDYNDASSPQETDFPFLDPLSLSQETEITLSLSQEMEITYQDPDPLSLSQETERTYQDPDPPSLDLGNVEKELKILMTKVKKIYDENIFEISGVAVKQLEHSSTESGGIGGSGSSRGSNTPKVVKEKVVVGFEEEVERLLDKLDDRGEGRPLEIISIIGAGGGGKTTLAREVYDHHFTSYTFGIRVWVDVSQDYDETRKRALLIRILESATPKKHEDYEKCSDDKLGEDILKCLKGKKYLIVMDDIWSIEAWNDIQRSFPKEHMGSKVLFTSRLLVQLDGIGYIPHYLVPLPTNWCWELLQKTVFGMECCPPELVDIGEQIAEKCEGLPLAVVSIAGILAMKDKTLDVWEKVAKHLSSIIAKNQEGCMEILELSYNYLPLHLKACFLYIGGYPEDNEIPIRELIWLWIAEGFIEQSEGEKSLESIAKDYLIGLIDRSLVQVARKSPLGGIKACRIHDLLRELCLKKAEDDNFCVRVYKNDSFSPSATNKHRRLLFDHQFFQELSSRFQNVRSLHSFMFLRSPEGFQSGGEINISFFVENFELLRVLNFKPNAFRGEIGIGHLVHLRYLAYMFQNFDERKLKSSYLLNLETLNIHDSFGGRPIQLPSDIFKMVKLRHLYSKKGVFAFHDYSAGQAFFKRTGSIGFEEAGSIGFDRSSKLDSLRTLQRICACEICYRFLVRTPNLRKLGLYGGPITDHNNVLWFHIEFLKCLEKLTLSGSWAFDPSTKSTLPPGLKLPLTITQITFKLTRLKWEELSLLQALPSLEVLRLINQACNGAVWNVSELEGFPQLKYLKFYDLNIKKWIASEDQFRKLEVLVLRQCRELEQIPIDFGKLYDLREIKLEFCSRSTEESAREIQEEQRNRIGDDDCLNLLIKSYPHSY